MKYDLRYDPTEPVIDFFRELVHHVLDDRMDELEDLINLPNYTSEEEKRLRKLLKAYIKVKKDLEELQKDLYGDDPDYVEFFEEKEVI